MNITQITQITEITEITHFTLKKNLILLNFKNFGGSASAGQNCKAPSLYLSCEDVLCPGDFAAKFTPQ